MREILFRGKRIDTGAWVQGYYFKVWDEHYICWGTTNGEVNKLLVIPETVGQSTGLDDKNGVKIFEGDIMNLKYPRDRRYNVVAKVINGQEISAMVLKFDNDFTTEEFPLYKISAENNLEVIGNVHDNPELMENDTD